MNAGVATKTYFARDLMVRRIRTVSPDDRVFEAVNLMLKHNISGTPVVDEHNQVVGMISHHDGIRALMRAVMERMPPSRVRDVMTSDVISIPPETHLLTVAHMFLYKGLRRIPVVDENGKLLGQISRSDLLRKATEAWTTAPSRDTAILYLSALPDTMPPR